MMSNSRAQTPRSSMSASVNGLPLKSPKTRQERQERQTNFKVVIRVRPPLQRELQGDIPYQNIIAIDDREQCITVSENLDAVLDEDGQVLANPGPYSTHSFMFDYVYDQQSTQKKVYETTARSVVDSALQGYNATIFAYGQTGTGKTFTMEGFNGQGSVEARGIIPRAIEQIFGHISKYASPRMRFLVRASYLQIYNETISDLLKPERNNLTIREDKKKGVFVDQLSEWVVRSPAEIYGLMERGGQERATGETKMNEYSSRSHAVFIVIAEQSETVYVDDRGQEMTPEEFQKFMHGRGVRREQEMNKLEDHVRQSFKVGKLNLVDLAGSERVRLSGATGQRLEECKQINSSLSHLGFVISALTDPKNRQHIPYRNSKLTRMLEDSLGGNCKTTMMAMVSPAFESMLETISTLKFANRAKNIRNEARVNEDLDQKSLLRKYERELKQLRAELEERSKNVVDKRRLLELDDQRRRAEADKMAAIRALEARSLEFMHEKEEKKKLEARIASLMGQMIRGERTGDIGGDGGHSLNPDGSAPELHEMMKEQQDKLRQEYEHKLAGLERERETIEEEKAQVDRYKQLLLKQRDIMIALTQRLVERDEQIMSLQDELDAYDRHHKELEEKLDEKTAMLIKFQRISMEVNASSPYKNEELGKAMDSWTRTDGNRNLGATELPTEDSDSNSPSGAGTSAKNGDTAALEEKLRNLNVVLGSQRAKISTLETQVDESRAAVSRERAAQSDLDSARTEIAALKARNLVLESGGSRGDSAELQAKCSKLTADREAIQTIVEHKIKVLVHSVAQAASAVISSSPQNAGGMGQALAKSIDDLRSLVDASIKAMRNNASQTTSSNGNNSSYPPQPPLGHSSNNANSVSRPVGSAPVDPAARYSYSSLPPAHNTTPSGYNRPAAYDPSSGAGSSGGSSSYSTLPGGADYRPIPISSTAGHDNHSLGASTNYQPVHGSHNGAPSHRPLASLPSPARSAPQIPFSSGNQSSSGGLVDSSSGGTILSRHYQQQQQQQQALLSSSRGLAGGSQDGSVAGQSSSFLTPSLASSSAGSSGMGSSGLYSSRR